MKLKIRHEQLEDHHQVALLIENAFRNEHFSDHQEQYLVDRLRKSPDFIPELSLVALFNEQLVGHVLLSKIEIKNSNNTSELLALVPVSVSPAYQKQGIGSALINAAHAKALELGFNAVLLLGQDTYFQRFGYEFTSKYNIEFPFDIPEKYCLIKPLKKDGLNNVSGAVEYPEAFY